jgi:hypothetical protein
MFSLKLVVIVSYSIVIDAGKNRDGAQVRPCHAMPVTGEPFGIFAHNSGDLFLTLQVSVL